MESPMLSPTTDRAAASSQAPAPRLPSGIEQARHSTAHPPDPERDEGFAAVLAVAADLLDCPCTMLWVAQGARLRLAATRGMPLPPSSSGTRLGSAVNAG